MGGRGVYNYYRAVAHGVTNVVQLILRGKRRLAAYTLNAHAVYVGGDAIKHVYIYIYIYMYSCRVVLNLLD